MKDALEQIAKGLCIAVVKLKGRSVVHASESCPSCVARKALKEMS